VDVAGGRADLFIGVRADVFHEEIEDARVALEHAEQLQGAVFRMDLGFWRRRRYRRRFDDQAEFRKNVIGQFAGKEEREKGSES
jgi:hypothetical protein